MPNIKEAIIQTASLAHLLEQANDHQTLIDSLTDALPQSLHGDPLSIREQGKVLTLIASNSAQAAKLRQLIPSFQKALLNTGYAFESIRITINKQATFSPATTDTPLMIDKPTLSNRTIMQILECADRLKEHPSLAQALKRFAKKYRKTPPDDFN